MKRRDMDARFGNLKEERSVKKIECKGRGN